MAMADDKAKPVDDSPQLPVVQSSLLSAQRAEQQELAQIAALAESLQADETPFPGGRFRRADGTYVDAEGRPHKDQKSD